MYEGNLKSPSLNNPISLQVRGNIRGERIPTPEKLAGYLGKVVAKITTVYLLDAEKPAPTTVAPEERGRNPGSPESSHRTVPNFESVLWLSGYEVGRTWCRPY